MRYLPINLDVRGRTIVVVGGGGVAWRKVEGLLECGAAVTVVSPDFCAELAARAGITRARRAYRTGDLAGACLVISATDSEATNRQVWADASGAGIPCNVVDQPELCSFTVPAVLQRGDLAIAISTGGVSPALAGRLRRQLEAELDPTVERHLRLLAEMRPLVKASALVPAARSRLLKAMADEGIGRIIATEGAVGARRHLRRMLRTAERAHAGGGPARSGRRAGRSQVGGKAKRT